MGPIGVLCVRRTLTEGRAAGLLSGLGAATADTIYGCIAGFGLTFMTQALMAQHFWLGLIGGLFLCYLGIKTFRTPPAETAAPAAGKGLAGAYASTFLLTLTNPMTILSFAAVFAGLGLATSDRNVVDAGVLVAGVFIGSAMWWTILSVGVGAVRGRFDQRRLRWVNRISGAVILAFGVAALVSGLRSAR